VADSADVASERVEIVLADDHAMVRGGLRRVLDVEVDLSVVAEAGDVEAALDQTRKHQPGIVLLDLNMPGVPTLSAIPSFLEAAPGSAVVVLTMEADPGVARNALSLTGRVLFDRHSELDKLWAHVHDPPARLLSIDPSLPPGLADALDRALAKDPDQRPQSAGEFARSALGALAV
jgi:DNA-binding NarL/FixJ family response regulator